MCAHWCGRVRLNSSKELNREGAKIPLLSAPESYSGWRGFEMGGKKDGRSHLLSHDSKFFRHSCSSCCCPGG